MTAPRRTEAQPPALHGGFNVFALSAVGEEVWAVGRAPGPALIAHSAHGDPWTPISSAPADASTQLHGVHATSADDVWAVGHVHDPSSGGDRTHIAHRDATGWHVVPSPNVVEGSNRLAAVAAHGRDDACAVGARTTIPLSSTPFGIPPVDAWDSLAARWDGSRWAAVPDPGHGLLSGVCTVGAGTYWAVGTTTPAGRSDNAALVALHEHGEWHRVETHGAGTLFGTDANGPDDVWAVGQAQDPAQPAGPMVLHYDGHAWAPSTLPKIGGTAWLNDVASSDDGTAWAVGARQGPDGRPGPLVVRFDGTAWAVVEAPVTAAPAVLNAVTALPGGHAFAGGFASPSPGDSGYVLAPTSDEGGG